MKIAFDYFAVVIVGVAMGLVAERGYCDVPNEKAPLIAFEGASEYEENVPIFHGDIKIIFDREKDRDHLDMGGGFLEIVEDGVYQKGLKDDLRFGEPREGLIIDLPKYSYRNLNCIVPIDKLTLGEDGITKYWVRGAVYGGKYLGKRRLSGLEKLIAPTVQMAGESFDGIYYRTNPNDNNNPYDDYYVSNYYPFNVSYNLDASQKNKESNLAGYTSIKSELFKLDIPSSYDEVTGSQLAQMKDFMMNRGKELAKQSSLADSVEVESNGLSFFSAYQSKNKNITVVFMGMRVGGEWVREEIYKANKQRIEWGVKSGGLSKNSNGVTKLSIDNIPALLMDIETSAGARMLTYSLFVPSFPSNSYQIGFIADDNKALEQHKIDIKAIVDSISLRSNLNFNF